MPDELYKRLRPTDFDEVYGQPGICRDLQMAIEKKRLPHTILFAGPSGTGKTTLARILRTHLNCSPIDFIELNCADARGIDDIREIRNQMSAVTLGGRTRIFLIDESHKITVDGMNALLKMLEDTPKHVYFILCTTDPKKLLPTIRTRCTTFTLQSLSVEVLRDLISSVAKADNIKIKSEVVEEIVSAAEGSARTALVILDQIRDIPTVAEQIAAIGAADHKTAAIQIARALMNPRTTWKEMAGILRSIEEDAETLRRIILGYASAILLSGKMDTRALSILEEFNHHYYDVGKPGLVASCYVVCSQK